MVAHFFAARPAPGYHVPMPARLEARGLTVEIPTTSGWVRPVNDVSFSLAEGESLGIVGESGSGKTMLALALMGLLPPGARAKGEALLVRRDATTAANNPLARRAENLLAIPPAEMRAIRGREIAMIFQEPMTALNPVMRIGAQIEEAIRVHEPLCASKRNPRASFGSTRTRRGPAAARARAPISAPAFRRPSPARDDRDGARREPWRADCRRAHHRARRHRASANPRAARATCAANCVSRFSSSRTTSESSRKSRIASP